MAKDRKKRKYLQGMEHLQREIQSSANIDDFQETSSEYKTLKKDLLFTTILMSIFILIIVALMVFENTSNNYLTLAEKITSIFIK